MTSPKKIVKLNSLRADITKEREGDWQKSPELGEGVELLVRSTNYPPYQLARDQASAWLTKTYPNAALPVDDDNFEPVPTDILARVNGEVYAEHLLLGWKGFDVDYTPGLALECLCAEEHRQLRNGVVLAATRVGRQEVEFVETTAKN